MKVQGGYSAEGDGRKRPAAPTTGSGVASPNSRQANTELLKALEPLAILAHEYDLAALDDEAVIEVPCKHLRKAWVVFAKYAGDA